MSTSKRGRSEVLVPVNQTSQKNIKLKHIKGLDDSVFTEPPTPSSTRKLRVARSNLDSIQQAKFKEIETQCRRLVLERSILLKDVACRDEEVKKLTFKQQSLMKIKTHLQSTIAGHEKELKELRKSNDILKTKNGVLENTGMKKNKIHVDLANARGLLVAKDHDIADFKSEIISLKSELEEKKDDAEKIKKLCEEMKTLQEKITSLEKENSTLKLYSIENLEVAAASEELDRLKLCQEELTMKHELKSKRILELQCEVYTTQEKYASSLDCSDSLQAYKDTLNERVSLLKDHNYELENQCDNYLETIKIMESQVAGICQEKKSVEDALYDALKEADSLRQELTSSKDLEMKLNTVKEGLEKEVADLEVEISTMKLEVETERDKHHERVEALNEFRIQIEKECEDLKKGNEDLVQEKVALDEKIKQVEEENDVLKEKMAHQHEEIESLNSWKIKIEEERDCLQKTNEDVTKRNAVLDEKIEQVMQEKDVLGKKLEQVVKEKAVLEEKIEQVMQEKAVLEDKIEQVMQEKAVLEEKIEQVMQEKAVLEEKIEHVMQERDILDDKIKKMMQEKGLLKENIENQLQEIQSLHAVRNEIEKESVCLQKVNEDLIEEKTVLEVEIERLMINKVSIEKENAAKAKVIEEGTALVKQLQRKQAELEHVLQGKDIELNVCNDELKTIQECVKDMKWQLQEGKENYTNLESTVTTLECEKKDLKYNIDDIANVLKEKEEILSDTYEKLREIEIELLDKHTILEDVATQNQNLEEALNNRNDEINRLMLENCQLEKNLKEMKDELNGFYEEKIVLVENLKELKEKLVIKETEVDETNEKLDNVIGDNCRLEEEVSNLKNVISNNEQQINELTKHSDDILSVQQELTCRVLDFESRLTQKDGVIVELEREKREVELLSEEMVLRGQQLEKQLMDKEEKVHELLKFKNELIESSNEQHKCIADQRLEISEIRDSNVWMKNELDQLRANLEWCKTRMDKMLKDESDAEEKLRAEKEEKIKWKKMFDVLQAKVEPFQEQLDMFEVEKNSLLSENSAAYDEVAKTNKKYAALLGHQNQKQKIHHVVKLKEDNINMKKELSKSREHILKLQKKINRLEDQMKTPLKKRRFDPSQAFVHQEKENYPFHDTN